MLINLYGRPLCVNCDWLSFSARFKPNEAISAPSGFRWEQYPGTNIYRERWILYDSSGAKVMTICAVPYSSVIPEDLCLCQIANPFLYSPSPSWLLGLLSSFRCAVYHGLSRWDVCCDFCPSDAEYKTIRKLTSGAQYVAGKSEGSLFWHSESYKGTEVRMAHCLSWGCHTSALKVKLYNKSLEIDAAHSDLCHKPWILSEWDCHLPDVTKVWRLEFSLTDANQFAIDERRLSFGDALSADVLCRFFAEVKRKRFVVRMNQGRRSGHKNLDEIVPFLPFDMDGISICRADAMSERSALDDERQLARRLVMSMDMPSVLMDSMLYQNLRSSLLMLCESPLVCSYVDKLVGGSAADWIARLDSSVGDGVFSIRI